MQYSVQGIHLWRGTVCYLSCPMVVTTCAHKCSEEKGSSTHVHLIELSVHRGKYHDLFSAFHPADVPQADNL